VRSSWKVFTKPTCLVDNDVNSGGEREIFGMPCNVAAEIADGREIWATTSFPNLMRWNNWNLKLSWNAEEQVGLRIRGDEADSTISLKQNMNLVAYNVQKCVDIKNPVDFD